MEQPTLVGYTNFIRISVGVPASVLPDDSWFIAISYNTALNIVNYKMGYVYNHDSDLPSVYTLCVYNFGADRLIQHATDMMGAPIYNDGLPFWAYWRKYYGMSSFVPGVLSSASDQGTSQSYQLANWMGDLNMMNLGQLKTPWGRAYLELAQLAGPTDWGIT